MDLKFSIQTRINKPIEEVFNAVADGKEICSYFTDKTSGPLEENKTVTWHWTGYGDCPVQVEQIIPLEKIILGWQPRHEKLKRQTILKIDLRK